MHVESKLLIDGLIKEREKLLKASPELLVYQNEIETELDRLPAGADVDPMIRTQKLIEMLRHKINHELLPARTRLTQIQMMLDHNTLDDVA